MKNSCHKGLTINMQTWSKKYHSIDFLVKMVSSRKMKLSDDKGLYVRNPKILVLFISNLIRCHSNPIDILSSFKLKFISGPQN